MTKTEIGNSRGISHAALLKGKRHMLQIESIRLTEKELQLVEDEMERAPKEGLAEVFDEYALATLDYLPRLQRLWLRIDRTQEMELGKYRNEVKMYVDLLARFIAFLEKLNSGQKGYDLVAEGEKGVLVALVKTTEKVKQGLSKLQELKNRAQDLLAWLSKPTPPADPAVLEESRRAFKAGDYQDLRGRAHGLQGDSKQRGKS